MARYTGTRNWLLDIKELIKPYSVKFAIDGGAHKGVYTKDLLSLSPSLVVHAFEPIPALCVLMRNNLGKRVHVHQMALGSTNTKHSFNILHAPGASSILTPSKTLKQFQGKKAQVSTRITVNCRRLDSIITAPIDLIKLDLQGYELEALKGCGALLKTVKLIFIEIEFIDLYDNQPLFSDIDLYLRKQNFKLFNFYNLAESNKGQLSGGNAIYLNRGFYD